MHIGLVGSTYPPIPGGVEVYMKEVAQALRQAGHDVTVATRFAEKRPEGGTHGLLTTSARSRHYIEDGIRVHVLGTGPLRQWALRPAYRLHFHEITRAVALQLFNFAYRTSLTHALNEVDVIHYSGTGRELLGFVAARVASDWNLPYVVTSHLHINAWGDGPLDMRLYQQADQYIALTEHEKKHVINRGLAPKKVSVIGHGTNVSGMGNCARMRERLDINGPMVLYLGRKASYKGYPLLLAAIPHVWSHAPETHFVFAGPNDGDQTEKIRNHYSNTLADKRVHELGFVSDEEREDLYAACDVFCLPSKAEAYGLVYLEAWTYSTPVVALRIPTLEELIGNVGGGILTSSNTQSVAKALIQLVKNPAQARRLGEAGRTRAKQHTWTRVANRLTQVYESEMSV